MKTSIFFNVLALSALTLTACSEDKYTGEVPNNFYIQPTEECGYTTYYTPAKGRIGDPMPFYDEKAGEFKVLYLQEYDNNLEKRFHPIWTVTTKDGANYQNLGETLSIGEYDWQQDAALGTGCCYYNKKDSLYYIYYTGHNGNCDSREVVMRATSPDYKTWTRDKGWALFGDDYGFSKTDFRDPQIFEDAGVYHMIISSSRGDRNFFAEFTSTDLKNWEFNRPIKMVWNDRMSECPDVFKMGDWWYLVFSDQSVWGRCVKYIKGTSLDDLYQAIENSTFPNNDEGKLDNRGFFAGKTASNGKDRYIWGWSPIRRGADNWDKNSSVTDSKEPAWAGALVCHKLIQHEDGSLSFGPVPGIEAKYNKAVEVKAVECSEGATYSNGNAELSGDSYVRFNNLGTSNHISFTVKVENPTDKFGISLVRSDYYRYCSINFNNPHWEPAKSNMCRLEFLQVFKHEKDEDPSGFEFINGALSNFVPRPADNTYNVDIYTDHSVVVLYYNNVLSYTTRVYGIENNGWSINSYGGKVEVSNIKVSQN